MSGWIAVDLDGTLAQCDDTTGFPEIGPPIPRMVERVKAWLAEGRDVRIFTARIHVDEYDERWIASARELLSAQGNIEAATGTDALVAETWEAIERNRIYTWCREHLGRQLPVTCSKDFQMVELWDDRCEQMIPNTGVTISELFTKVAGQPVALAELTRRMLNL